MLIRSSCGEHNDYLYKLNVPELLEARKIKEQIAFLKKVYLM
jgi:hypothetical protein